MSDEKKKRVPLLVLIIAGVLCLLVLASAGAAFTWEVYVKHSEGVFIRKTAEILPITAAKVGSKKVLFRDFLKSKDTLRTFLNSPAAKEQNIGVPWDATLEKNVLEKLVSQAALEELAEQKDVTVSDEELRAFFADVISAVSSTTPDVGVYLLENYGWNEEDFRQNVLKPSLLEQRLATKMAEENNGDESALATYMEKRLQEKDVVRYLKF
ncbi:SurA N-terminal domain-containing protein [Patescibacteria group bacterium]|nr:SurA N-terminal domain-containing protein [Patescibacteria group bacterium]MBU1034403.1 SurA N-terminal domain-containing protein [Patescibacteria group bacterium]MBU1629462.1 SurA N-terminal domain-containing protein [Patescibacteria group bacterium]MBU1908006.1 SurA N-terminal domain-containing protein [Patescibacteria group bacterium]